MTKKICQNCKWFEETDIHFHKETSHICKHKKATSAHESLIVVTKQQYTCYYMRHISECGEEGRLYEDKK